MTRVMDVTMFWGGHSGGIRRHVLTKRHWIARDPAWRHTLVAPGASGADTVDVGSLHLPCTGGYSLPWRLAGLADRLAAAGPDLLELADPFMLSGPALHAARSLGVPVVGFCHSNVAAMGRRWGGRLAEDLARRHLCRVYGQCDLVLAPSQDMVRQLHDWGLGHAQRQALGVDTQVFHPACRDPGWRSELGLLPGSLVLVYAGRFAPEKNLHVLAAAAQRLGTACTLVCVGDGPKPPGGSRTIRLPFTNDRAALARLLASADIFVHAGDQETFGLSVLEAMACGCPVVGLAAAGLAELIDTHVGQAVSRNTPEEFAEAITATLHRDREKLGRAARARALTHSWEHVLPGLFARYEALIQPRYNAKCAVNNASTAANSTSLG